MEGNTYEGNPGEVPEDDQETPFLVEHVPGLGDALLTLAASVEVKPRREDHERHVLGSCSVRTLRIVCGRDLPG